MTTTMSRETEMARMSAMTEFDRAMQLAAWDDEIDEARIADRAFLDGRLKEIALSINRQTAVLVLVLVTMIGSLATYVITNAG